MLTKLVLRQTRVQLLRTLVRRSHETHIPEKYMKFRTGHMDEALKPSGDWKEAYNALQSKYNKQLIISTIFFGITMAYLYQTVDLVLPPPYKNE